MRRACCPTAAKFNGPDELRAILSSDREAFARALTSKLLTYALGRGLERYDTKTVKAIAAAAAGAATTGSRRWCWRS